MKTFGQGVFVALMVLIVISYLFGLGYLIGTDRAWRHASDIVGCEAPSELIEVSAYVTYDGKARRWMCSD